MRTTRTLEGLIQLQNDNTNYDNYFNVLISKDFDKAQQFVDPSTNNLIIDSLSTITDSLIVESNLIIKDSANIYNDLVVDGSLTSGTFIGDGSNITNIDACNISHGALDLVNLLDLHQYAGGCLTYDKDINKWSFASNVSITNDLVTQNVFDVNAYALSSTKITMDANIVVKGSVTRRTTTEISAQQVYTQQLAITNNSSNSGILINQLSFQPVGLFQVNNSTKVIIDQYGSVGIKTTNTQYHDLYVNGYTFSTYLAGDGSSITDLNTSKVSAGVLDVAYGGTGVSTSTGSGAVMLNTDPTFAGTLTGGTFSGNGSQITDLNTSKVSAGVLDVAYGGTGVSTSTGSGAVVLNNNPSLFGNIYIDGNLYVKGSNFIVDTDIQSTEQIIINNDGTGPALIVGQQGNNRIAEFSKNSNALVFIDTDGNIGIKTDNTQNYDLYVTGRSFSDVYYGSGSEIYSLNVSKVSAGVLDVAYGGTGTTIKTGTGALALNTNPVFAGVVTSDSFQGVGSNISELNVSKVSLGMLDIAYGGTGTDQYTGSNALVLNTNPVLEGVISGGTFSGDGSLLYNLNSSNVSSGILDVVYGGTGTTIKTGTGALALNTNPVFAGVVTSDSFQGVGSNISELNVSKVSSGILDIAYGGTGTDQYTGSNALVLNTNPVLEGVISGGTFSGDGSLLENINASYVNQGTLDIINVMQLDSNTNGCLAYDGNNWAISSNVTITNNLITQNVFDVGVWNPRNTKIALDANIVIKGSVTRRKFASIIADEVNIIGTGTFAPFRVSENSSNTWLFVDRYGSVGIRTDNTYMYDLYVCGTTYSDEYHGDGKNVTGLDASNIDSGVLQVAYGGTGTTESTGSGSAVLSESPSLSGNVLMNGKLVIKGNGGSNLFGASYSTNIGNSNPVINGVLTAQHFIGDGYNITNINAKNINIQTFDLASLLNVSGNGILAYDQSNWHVSSNVIADDVKSYLELSCNHYVISGLTDVSVSIDVSQYFSSSYNISYRAYIPYIQKNVSNGLSAVVFDNGILTINPNNRGNDYQIWIEGYVVEFDWYSKKMLVDVSEI